MTSASAAFALAFAFARALRLWIPALASLLFASVSGVMVTLVPIRPRSRGERRSLRTFSTFSPGVCATIRSKLALGDKDGDAGSRVVSRNARRETHDNTGEDRTMIVAHVDGSVEPKRFPPVAGVGVYYRRVETITNSHWSPYAPVHAVNAVP